MSLRIIPNPDYLPGSGAPTTITVREPDVNKDSSNTSTNGVSGGKKAVENNVAAETSPDASKQTHTSGRVNGGHRNSLSVFLGGF